MKSKNVALTILNAITFALMLFINYASNVRLFTNTTVADIAHKYDTLFAPADYAFIIWAAIFMLCAGFVIYQFTIIKKDLNRYIQRTGLWFAISNVANAAWVYCWINEQLGWCVILILILLLSLIILTIKLKLELNDEPVRIILFIWWPLSFYLGWIITATVACIASYLVSIKWNGFGLAPNIWTIIMLITAFLVYLFLNQKRNMRESAAVGIWAFVAVAVREHSSYPGIAITTVIASFILLVMIGRQVYKNWFYAPFNKIKRGEW